MGGPSGGYEEQWTCMSNSTSDLPVHREADRLKWSWVRRATKSSMAERVHQESCELCQQCRQIVTCCAPWQIENPNSIRRGGLYLEVGWLVGGDVQIAMHSFPRVGSDWVQYRD